LKVVECFDCKYFCHEDTAIEMKNKKYRPVGTVQIVAK